MGGRKGSLKYHTLRYFSPAPPSTTQWENNALQIRNELCTPRRAGIDRASQSARCTHTHIHTRCLAFRMIAVFLFDFISPVLYFPLNSAIYGGLYWRRLSIFMAFVWHADRQQEMTLDWLCWEMGPGRPGLLYYLAERCSRLPEWLYASVCFRP